MDKNINNLVTKQEAEQLKVIPGKVKGVVILANVEYVNLKGGKEAIKKIEERLKELGFPVIFKEIKPMEYYPEALSVLIVLLIRELMDFNDKEIFEMGRAAVKISFFIKILTKYFVSLKRCFEESPVYWQKHFDFGKIETVKFDEKNRQAILRVLDYKFHPIMCAYHKGYFSQVAQFALGSQVVEIQETKCAHKGDSYHEYIITWK